MSPSPRQPGLPAAITLCLASCMPVMAILVMAPVLPQIVAAFRTTPNVDILVPVSLTLPALMIALCGWFAGLAVDRFGRKPVLLASMACYAFFGMAPLVLDTLPGIIVSRALTGVVEAFIITASITLIGDYFTDDRRERYLSMQVAFTSITAIAFLAIGGFLGEYGWRAPFVMYALSLVLMVPAALLLREPANQDSANVEQVRTALGTRLLLCCGISMLAGIALYVPIVQNGFLLNALGITQAAEIGMIGSAGTAAILCGTVFFIVVRWIGIFWLLFISFGLTAMGLGVLAVAGTVALYIAGLLIASVGAGIFMPALSNWALAMLPFGTRGRGMGLWQAAFWLGQFVSPIVVAGLTQLSGSLHGAVDILAVGFVPVSVLCLLAATGYRPAAGVAIEKGF
jgi:MFS family permease